MCLASNENLVSRTYLCYTLIHKSHASVHGSVLDPATLSLQAYRVIVSSNDSSEAFPLVMTMQQISNSELQTVSLPFQGQRYRSG